LPMTPDQEAAWAAFCYHRAQYECAIMALIRLKHVSPGVRWWSDRPEATRPLPIPVFGSRSASATATNSLPRV
jgi:hypothetical protein